MYDFELKKMAQALEQEGLLVPVLEPEEAVIAVTKVLEKYWDGKIALTWSTGDVLGLAHPSTRDADGNEIPAEKWMSEEEAKEILEEVLDNHDACYGVSWGTFEDAIYELKKEKDKNDNN